MNCSGICKERAREMFPKCYGRLLLLGLCLSFPPACLDTAIRLFTSHIQQVGDRRRWVLRIVLPWFKSLLDQPEVLCLLVVSCLFFVILDIFILKVFSVGIRRYILVCKNGGDESIGDALFWGFNCGNYKNIVKTMFLRDLYIAGWSLLFIIPGIVKSLEYLAVPWLLAKRPGKTAARTFRRGKKIMRERKSDAFSTLYLSSLILWELLNVFISGLIFSGGGAVLPLIMNQATAVLLVFPYRLLTEGEFFLIVSDPVKVEELLKQESGSGEPESGELMDREDEAPAGLFWRRKSR